MSAHLSHVMSPPKGFDALFFEDGLDNLWPVDLGRGTADDLGPQLDDIQRLGNEAGGDARDASWNI